MHIFDDSTYIQTSTNHDVGEVTIKTQESQTMLEGLIKATGGSLNPTKSFWWLVDFKWSHRRWSLKTIEQSPAIITVKNANNTTETLERLQPNETKLILGVFQGPLNDGKEQTEKLREKMIQFVSKIRIEISNPTHAWLEITTRAMKAIEWPLVATTLTEQQCSRITAPLLKWGMTAMKIPFRTSRAITFAPPSVLGIGLPSLYSTMGIHRIAHLLNHGHKPTMTGRLIQINYQQLALEVGLPDEIFNWKYQKFGHLATHSWIAACTLRLHHPHKLRQPLGDWHDDKNSTWEWHYDPTNDAIYKKSKS